MHTQASWYHSVSYWIDFWVWEVLMNLGGMSYLFVQLHTVLDSKLWPKPGQQCMHRQPFPPWLAMSKWLEELRETRRIQSIISWFLENAARWGGKALYTSCLSVSSSKILDAKCVRCRMHEGCECINFHFTQVLIPQQDRVTQIVHQWTQQPQTKLKFNKRISISEEKQQRWRWLEQIKRSELNSENIQATSSGLRVLANLVKPQRSLVQSKMIVSSSASHTIAIHRHHAPHVQFHRLRQIVRWWRCGSDGMDTPQAWIARE